MELTLYSRSNCHLCEAMEAELSPLIDKYNLIVKRQYIDNEPILEQRYGSTIPVLTIGDEVVCEYFLDTDKLLKFINQA